MGSPAEREARLHIVFSAMYGAKSYVPGVDRADKATMLSALIAMHQDGTLTEGQVARATGLDRVTIRHLCDRIDAALNPAPKSTDLDHRE